MPTNEQETKTILGIDPGSNIMGYGIIIAGKKDTKLINLGTVKTSGYSTHYDKLSYIFKRTCHVIKEYQPDEVALEAPFFGKNVQSMLKLGRAQGVAMAAALSFDLPIFEYAPLKVKQSITGMGGASKEQVAYFLQKMYNIKEIPKNLDATDAIAVAVCHWIQSSRPKETKSYRNWEDFIRKNPGRIK